MMTLAIFDRMSLSHKKNSLSSDSEVAVYRGRKVDPLPQREQRLLYSLLSLEEKFFLNIEHFWGIKRECISKAYIGIVWKMDSHLQQTYLILSRLNHVGSLNTGRIERYEQTLHTQLKLLADEAVGVRQAEWKAARVSSEEEYQRKKYTILFYQESAELPYLHHAAHREKRQKIDEALLRIHAMRPLNAKEGQIIANYWKYAGTVDGKLIQAETQARIKTLAVDSMTQVISQIIDLGVTANTNIVKQSLSIIQRLKLKSDETIQMLMQEYHKTRDPKTRDLNQEIVTLYILLMVKVYIFITATSILRRVRQQLQTSTSFYIQSLQKQHENQLLFEENYLSYNKEDLKKLEERLREEGGDKTQKSKLEIEIKITKELIADSEERIRQLRLKTADYWEEKGIREVNQVLGMLNNFIRQEKEAEHVVFALDEMEQTESLAVPDLTIALEEVDKYFVRKKRELDDRKLDLLDSVIANMS